MSKQKWDIFKSSVTLKCHWWFESCRLFHTSARVALWEMPVLLCFFPLLLDSWCFTLPNRFALAYIFFLFTIKPCSHSVNLPHNFVETCTVLTNSWKYMWGLKEDCLLLTHYILRLTFLKMCFVSCENSITDEGDRSTILVHGCSQAILAAPVNYNGQMYFMATMYQG